jgi:hypothetical protein
MFNLKHTSIREQGLRRSSLLHLRFASAPSTPALWHPCTFSLCLPSQTHTCNAVYTHMLPHASAINSVRIKHSKHANMQKVEDNCLLGCCVVQTDISEVLIYDPWLIALMMEKASTSETSVNFYQTTLCNIPEDSHLHTRRRENLKSHHAKTQ